MTVDGVPIKVSCKVDAVVLHKVSDRARSLTYNKKYFKDSVQKWQYETDLVITHGDKYYYNDTVTLKNDLYNGSNPKFTYSGNEMQYTGPERIYLKNTADIHIEGLVMCTDTELGRELKF